jgi:hypothetical protein
MSADLVSDCCSDIPPWHPKGDQKEPKGPQSTQRSPPRTVIGVTKSKTQLWLNCVLLFATPIFCLGGLLWVLCGPLGSFWSSLWSLWGALAQAQGAGKTWAHFVSTPGGYPMLNSPFAQRLNPISDQSVSYIILFRHHLFRPMGLP